MRLAAVDLGSLTVRLAVAERTGPGRFRVLRHLREITGLGRDPAGNSFLAPEAMDRTLLALERFRQVMDDYGVQAGQAVATQAVRQARNREDFLIRAREALAVPVRILAPEEEARLSLAGVLSALDARVLQAPAVAVCDVGGGSTEWALLRPGREPVFASLPLGVLTLGQGSLGDPPQPEAVAALKQGITARLSSFYQERLQPHLPEPPRLVGTAGAVTTLAAMALKLQVYDAERVNNFILTRDRVAALAERLASLPESVRARLPGLEAAKAGVMVAGSLIILAILEITQQDSLVVVDAGLLEGVLGELIKNGAKTHGS